MRLTLLSILATCLFPCLVDSTYGQAKSDIWQEEAGDFFWEGKSDIWELESGDFLWDAKLDIWGEESGDFIWREEDADGAVELYDRAAGNGRNQTIYYFAKSTDTDDDGTPTSQDRPVRGAFTISVINPKSNGDGGGSEKSGAIDHNSTRSNSGASDGKKGLNAVNVKVVMTGPGGPLVQDVTILPEKFTKTSSSGGGDDDAQLKQGNDMRVRKKPNRTTYANITLSSLTDGTDLASWDDGVEKGMTDLTNGSSVTLFDMDGEVAAATAIEHGLMAALLRMQQPVALPDPDLENSRTAIEYALIAALLRSTGSQGDLHVWHNGNETVMMNFESGSAVVMNNLPSNDNGPDTLLDEDQVFLYMETRIGGEDVHVNILIRKKPTL